MAVGGNMLQSIRQTTIVGEGGKIEISSPELSPGTTVEVIVVIEPEAMDTTDYLLSTEANRKQLREALKDLDNRAAYTFIQADDL
jgi:antitoxin YefM